MPAMFKVFAALSLIMNVGCSTKKNPSQTVGDSVVASDETSSNESGQSNQISSGQRYLKSVKPFVLSAPVLKQGTWLNGYYFITSDIEGWAEISTLIYGDSEMALKLKGWNDHLIPKAGQVIYYNSPHRSQDSQSMLSFSDDFNVLPVLHIVQPGDSLSKLAKNTWGNYDSWRAISAANPQIKHPDIIQIGEKIAIPVVKGVTNPKSTLLIGQTDHDQFDQVAQSPTVSDSQTTETMKPNSKQNISLLSTLRNQISLRPSSIITLIGLLLVLFSVSYVLWRKSQDEKINMNYDAYSDPRDLPSSTKENTLSRLTKLVKTKIGH